MTYQPPNVGDRLGNMEWTGEAWTVVCPVDDVAMTEYNASAELCCSVCGVSYLEQKRAER
jgi:hypothetical protein